jgi:hypothetical protein
MKRFDSLESVPNHTRAVLRRRLIQFLPQEISRRHLSPELRLYDDELVLSLLQRLSLVRADAPEQVQATFDNEGSDIDGTVPGLPTLIRDGWVCKGWGRLSVEFDIERTLQAVFPSYEALVIWLKKRYLIKWGWHSKSGDSKGLAALAVEVVDGRLHPSHMACPTPEWVAARLWDRRAAGPADSQARLLWWVERSSTLGALEIVPSEAWDESQTNAFISAAFSVIEDSANFHEWHGYRSLVQQQIAHAANRSPADYELYVPSVPNSLVDKVDWLSKEQVQHAHFAISKASYYALALVRAICRDVDAQDNAPAPHPASAQLFQFGASHPEVLAAVVSECQTRPRLVADLLMHPATAALACLIVERWRFAPDIWDRNLSESENSRSKTEAFTDAVCVMGHWLAQRRLPLGEVVSLFCWMHEVANVGRGADEEGKETRLDTLRRDLSRQQPDICEEMAAMLVERAGESKVGQAAFNAALDFVDTCRIEPQNSDVLVSAYLSTVQTAVGHSSAHRISVSGAATLFRMAECSSLFATFLSPFALKKRLDEVDDPKDILVVSGQLAQAVRLHIRTLSRAIEGSRSEIGRGLVDALAKAIKIGATSHPEKGKVPAFELRFETTPWTDGDRPIASDVGAALSKLEESGREKVLRAVLDVDEPGFLAQLTTFAPPAVRGRLRERISELVPGEAGRAWSLTDVQMRIQQLLTAGALDTAEQYLDVESSTNPQITIPGRESMRLRFRLQLALLTEDWQTILASNVPNNFPDQERAPAQDSVDFYKALAQLAMPDGDVAAAVSMFGYLRNKSPHVAAYAINLFVAESRQLLKNDIFVELEADKAIAAKELLHESSELSRIKLEQADQDIFEQNKALLLLAIGQPVDAHHLLHPMYIARPTVIAAAYDAVSLFRIGRMQDALYLLDQAERDFGGEKLLKETRSFIQEKNNVRPSAAPAAVTTENLLAQIKSAMRDFLVLDPLQQAAVAVVSATPFETMVIEHVRAVAASVVSLVPMMRGIDFTTLEDDLSALVRELLGSRIAHLAWSIGDQPKGGYSANENPGERDLLIKKDTYELTVLEAVICRGKASNAANKVRLREHLEKLFGYSPCQLFFHLTYAFETTEAPTIEVLKGIAEQLDVRGIVFVGVEDIPFSDARPRSFIARYRLDSQDVAVAFIVLNLGQVTQRAAARKAGARRRTKAQAPKSGG